MTSAPAPGTVAAAPGTIASESRAVRVLVVDDELLIRWALREALGDRGFEVIEAVDGRSAVRALGEASPPPDVVLLDYRLPDSDGLALLTTIKSLVPRGQVILMTAYGTSEVTSGARDLGAYRVVIKPFEVHEMAALIAQAHRASSP
jgi:DNA-binding NtrC family response regulator